MSMQEATVNPDIGKNVFAIRVSKGRSGTLQCDPALLAEWVYARCVMEGAQKLANGGMTTIKKGDFDTEEEYKEAVMTKARSNLEAMYDGTLKIRGSGVSKDKHPPEVKVLARQMAKAAVKAELKKKGYKITQVPTRVITEMSNTALQAKPEFYERAYEEYNKRQAISISDIGIDFSPGAVPLDQKKIARAEEAKKAKQLSAAKAGQVATRGRPPLPRH